MSTTTELSKLTINYLTQAQYDAEVEGGTIDENALYLTPSESTPSVMADYIVEQGTSGIWTYRKWNSGVAECWGTTATRSITSWSAWGGIYIAAPYNTQDSYPSGLFISTPNCQATLNTSQGDFFLIKYSTSNAAGSKDKTNAYYVARGTNGSSGTTYSISYYAIGKWQ